METWIVVLIVPESLSQPSTIIITIFIIHLASIIHAAFVQWIVKDQRHHN